MIAHISHIEWSVANGKALVNFLQQCFSWEFEKWSEHYWLYQPGDGVAIGVLEKEAAVVDEIGSSFITVESISNTVALAVSLGAIVIEDKTKITDYGHYAKIREPQGNLIGLFQR